MLPFFAAIGLFVMLVLLWLGETFVERDRPPRRNAKRRLPPGTRRS